MQITLGAVAYDPKVVTIWEGFRTWFAKHDLDFDFLLYSNYERQVVGHFRGEYDVAWNSPLAWIQAERVAARYGRTADAFAMRDTDRDLSSVVLVTADGPVQEVQDLVGKRVAVGAKDSPQATLIPLEHLAAQGLRPGVDFEVVYFDRLVGKHGDHIGGERDAARALVAGDVDAACVIDGNYLLFTHEGTLPEATTRALTTTGVYDHCVFTALDDLEPARKARFTELLLGQSWEDPEVRPLLELEGLKQWKLGRTEGFQLLNAACDRFGTIDRFVAQV